MLIRVSGKLIGWGLLSRVLSVLVCGFLTAAVSVSSVARAATINVTSTADNTTDDTDCTLREAISSANNDSSPNPGDCTAGSGTDTISIPAGTYALTTGSALAITSNVTITGAGVASTTVQQKASPTERVFTATGSANSVTFEDLTIKGGNASAASGVDSQGGGIYSTVGNLTITRCTLDTNTANTQGGGVAIGVTTGTATVLITDSTFSGNVADGGSGVGRGGGLVNNDTQGDITIDGSTFSNNTAGVGATEGDGGGIHTSHESKITVTNSTFSGNKANRHGGGISIAHSLAVLDLNNVTITDNDCDFNNDGIGEGGGIFVSVGTVNASNTIIAGNRDPSTAPDCRGAYTSNGNNFIGDNSNCTGFTDGVNGDQVGAPGSPKDPGLAPLGDYTGPTQTHAPCTSSGVPHASCTGLSPVIDTGANGTCEGVDQRDVVRPVGATCDIGSVEATVCGNSVIEGNEECDDGTANGTIDSCCTSTCTFKTSGTACTDDSNVCTDDQCNATGTCQHLNNTDPCDDGLFCNGADTCSGGTCSSHPGDPCAGPDGDSNCTESCDENADNCLANDPDGSGCNDGLFCTVTDTCTAGVCGGTGDPCPGPDGDGDCSETCNEASDDCTANDPNGSTCNDGLFCTATDTCTTGTCSGSGDPCVGGAECNVTCNEGTDDCFDPAGTQCTDDGDVCTADECDGAGLCGHVLIDSDGDGVCDNVEDGAPNSGDGNNDGTADSAQSAVTSLPNAVDGSYMTFVTNPCPHTSVAAVALAPDGYWLPFGGLSFELLNCASTTATIYYHNATDLPSPPYQYIKEGPNPPGAPTSVVYSLSTGTPNNLVMGSASPYGVSIGMAQFDLADNVQGDDTGTDGDIIDQGGPGLERPTPTPAMTPAGLAVALLAMAIVAFVAFRRRRRVRQ